MWIIYTVLALISFIVWIMVSPLLSSIIEGTLGVTYMGGVTNFLIRLIVWVGLFFGLYKIVNAVKGVQRQ